MGNSNINTIMRPMSSSCLSATGNIKSKHANSEFYGFPSPLPAWTYDSLISEDPSLNLEALGRQSKETGDADFLAYVSAVKMARQRMVNSYRQLWQEHAHRTL